MEPHFEPLPEVDSLPLETLAVILNFLPFNQIARFVTFSLNIRVHSGVAASSHFPFTSLFSLPSRGKLLLFPRYGNNYYCLPAQFSRAAGALL